MTSPNQTLTPRLVVPSADAAITFYSAAFGARLIERFALPSGHVVHAAMAIDTSIFSLTEARPDWDLPDVAALEGSPVLLSLNTDDPDAVCAKAVSLGARVLIPIDDRFYGRREGRIADPFGHRWILSREIEALSSEEIERRMATMG